MGSRASVVAAAQPLLIRDRHNRSRSEPFVTNTPVVVQVSEDGYLESVDVGFDGDIVVSGGAASGTATGRENPEAIVESIEVLTQRKGTIKRLPIRAYLFWHLFDRGRVSALGADISGAAATYTQAGHFPVNFALPSLVRPFETALNTRRYGQIQLIFNCKDQSQILTGNDRAWNFGALRFNIEELRNLSAIPADPAMDTDLLIEWEEIKEVTASTIEFSMRLPVGYRYKEILFTAEVDNVLSDAVINSIRVETDGQTWFDLQENAIKRFQRRRITDAAQVDTGLYLVDLCPSGLKTRTPDARGLSNVKAILDVTKPAGTVFIKAYCRAILPNENL